MAFKAKYLGDSEGTLRAFGASFNDGVAELDDSFRTKVEGNRFFEVVGQETIPNPKGEPVDIPADWEDLHWKKQVELALAIVGGSGPLVPSEGQTEAQKAKAIIASEVAGRSE